MSDALLILLGVNLAIVVTVALVMAMRLPVRRLFGPRVAYGLWSLVPLASLALFLPARVVKVVVPAAPQSSQMIFDPGLAGDVPTAPGVLPLAVALWIAGGIVSLGWLAWRQLQFARAAREGLAGPAVVGLLRPRIVTPFDFSRHYTAREQLVVLAHEATHIRRHDTLANAAVALAACVNWFNPAIHVLARYLRIDQEFACDAQVIAAHPTARRSYAEAMLKTQLAARALPIGCYWPAQSPHPLAQRIRLLARPDPGHGRRRVGTVVVALLGLAAAASAWAARPAQVVTVVAETQSRPAARSAALSAHPDAGARPSPPTSAGKPAASGWEPPQQPATALQADAAATTAAADAQPSPVQAETPQPDPPFRASRIHSVARRSMVEAGSAVRVLATMVDPEGRRLTTDLTAFGSQSAYRTGWFERNGSRYALFTSVAQDGDRLVVSASLDRRFEPRNSGSVVLSPGQTGQITLGDGQVVTVTPTVRPETPQEVEEGQRAVRNRPSPPRPPNPAWWGRDRAADL
jgi:beta-lactamase regulating signal transducer with metallopeptidase domain